MAQKITHWLLVALVLSLGFGQLLRFDLLSVPIYLHDILVLLLLLFLVTSLAMQYKDRNYVIPLGLKLFVAGLTLSSLRALTLYPVSSLLVPSLYTFRLLAYIALYLLLRSQKVKIPYKYFFIGGMVQWCIGVIQYLWIPDMRMFQSLGWDDHLSRLTLPHFDPTFTAVMLGLFLLSILNSTTLYPILHTLYLLPAILLTYSRSVWLSLIFTATLFIKNKRVLLVAVALLIITIFALPQRFGEGTNLLRTYSISSRIESDLSYIQKYQWDLLTGRGLNTLILDSSNSRTHATGPNSSYLYLLTTTGILGLIGWGLFMFTLYAKSSYKPMLIFFFIASLFNNVMFYPFALLWVLLIEAMVPTAA